jgi:pimeloyl-ACP methyl ester carboxylesterase
VQLTPFERSRVIRVGIVDAHIAESGPESAVPIVFVHGNPDSSEVWSEVARRLAPEARCIAPDLPNWGKSIAHGRFDCSLAHQAAYTEGVVDALGLDAVHLVVHDIGGAFGLAFATLRPHRIRTLTIFNTSFFRHYRWHTLGRLWRTPVVGELIMLVAFRRWFVNGMIDAAPLLPREYAERAWAGFRCRTRRMVLRYYRAMDFAKVMVGWDERMLAATKSIPKQVIWGMKDPYVPAAMAEWFDAPVHRLPESSHWAMMENPDASARLIGSLVHAGKPAAARG